MLREELISPTVVAPVRPAVTHAPHWRALLEARWRARLYEVTRLSLAYHGAAAAAPAGRSAAGQREVERLLHSTVAARRKLADTEEALAPLRAVRGGDPGGAADRPARDRVLPALRRPGGTLVTGTHVLPDPRCDRRVRARAAVRAGHERPGRSPGPRPHQRPATQAHPASGPHRPADAGRDRPRPASTAIPWRRLPPGSASPAPPSTGTSQVRLHGGEAARAASVPYRLDRPQEAYCPVDPSQTMPSAGAPRRTRRRAPEPHRIPSEHDPEENQ